MRVCVYFEDRQSICLLRLELLNGVTRLVCVCVVTSAVIELDLKTLGVMREI